MVPTILTYDLRCEETRCEETRLAYLCARGLKIRNLITLPQQKNCRDIDWYPPELLLLDNIVWALP